MWKVLIVALWCLLVLGCNQAKMPKGDTGTTGDNGASMTISTQTYTCPPTANPYYKTCSWLCNTVLPKKPAKKTN
jgi:hypothetical protein